MALLLFFLLAIVLAGTQLLLGGKEPAFSLPGYGVLALGAVLSVGAWRCVSLSRRTLVCVATSVVFFGCIGTRALFSEDHYLARRDLYLALAVLVVYLLVAWHVTSPRLRFSLVGLLLILAVVDTAIGALQYQRGDGFMPFEFLPAVGYGARARGFFGCPNHLAGFLEVVAMLGLSAAFWSAGPWWGRILIGYASAVCVVGVMLTGSRGGYMALAAGLMSLACLSALLLNQRGRPSLALALVASLVVALAAGAWIIQAALPAVSTVREKVHSVVSLEVAVEDCRPRLWRSALRQAGVRPLVGTGSGTFLYYGRQFRDPSIQTDPVYAHSDYLQLLGEYGIVGAVGFLLFFGCHLVRGWMAFRQQSSLYAGYEGGDQGGSVALTMGALCGTVAIAVHSWVDFNLHIPANTLFVAFIFGVLANPGGERHGLNPAWLPRFRIMLPALGLGLATVVLPALPAEYEVARAKALLADARYLESAAVAGRIVEFSEAGLRYDSRNTELYDCLGEAHFALAGNSSSPAESRAHHEKAVAAYRRARDIAPRDVRLYLCEAISLDALQHYDEAGSILDQARELDPNSIYVLQACASHLYAEKKFSQAEATYQKARQLGSEGAQYWLDILAQEKKAGRLGATSAGLPAAASAP